MYTVKHTIQVFNRDLGHFSTVRNSNVLIYFPHGFGDHVQLSYVASLFEPSNRYWICQFGDDNVSLYEGHSVIRPLYIGINSVRLGDGEAYDIQHFGMNYGWQNGREQIVELPCSLYQQIKKLQIDCIFWAYFEEIKGEAAFPYHTKARNFLGAISGYDEEQRKTLNVALTSSLNFAAPDYLIRLVESRLRSRCGYTGKKLCIISRDGYTSLEKTWGRNWREEMPRGLGVEGQECRDFMRLMRQIDSRWIFLIMENDLRTGFDTVRDIEVGAFSYAELFGCSESNYLPYGWIAKTLVSIADLAIGVPAGPYHLSVARADLPTVEIWLTHLPCQVTLRANSW